MTFTQKWLKTNDDGEDKIELIQRNALNNYVLGMQDQWRLHHKAIFG